MKKVGFALAAAAIAFTASSAAFAEPTSPAPMRVAEVVVKKKVVVRHGPVTRRKVVIHSDRGLHRGWRHSRHYGRTTTVVRKKTVVH